MNLHAISLYYCSMNTDKKSIYMPVKYKLIIALMASFVWVGFSCHLAWNWIGDLSELLSAPLAWFIVLGIAIIPGWANALIICGLLLDKRPQYPTHSHLPAITVLVAAFNEEDCIQATLQSLYKQEYAGSLNVIVIDDGSADKTADIVLDCIEQLTRPDFTLQLIRQDVNGGKSRALNIGAAAAQTDILVTVDADTYVYRGSLERLVVNLIDGPPNTAAVAGTVLVRNSRSNFLSRLQEWDYFLAISVIKRIQSLFQGTLVAQGAFSAYYKDAVLKAGGWSKTVGEDIVLTWALHEANYRVAYAENAFAFTSVPTSYKQFFRQRKRWARGLIEAFKRHPGTLIRPKLVTPFIYFNLFFPYLDFCYIFFFVPGFVAAVFFGMYHIVGLLTLLLLPLMLVINSIMYYRQKAIFQKYGLKIRKNLLGLVGYTFLYQLVSVPASLAGYAAEFLKAEKSWGTKDQGRARKAGGVRHKNRSGNAA